MTTRAAVLIPLYKPSMTLVEEYSFENTLSVLSEHDIYVVCPPELGSYLSVLKKDKSSLFNVEYLPAKFFASIEGYNSLLMSLGFYRRFERYEYILVVQTDVLVFGDQLDQWCDRGFSYIGAPWFHGLTRPTRSLSFLGVGNGGFSLRRVSDCIKVLSSSDCRPPINGKVTLRIGEILRLIPVVLHCLKLSTEIPFVRLDVNEDLFWGMVIPGRCDDFVVPRPEEAVPFAFEAAPKYLFELNRGQLPFGCHAWERYDPEFWRDTLSGLGMKLP
jgi:uncharacterized protein DUF5672